MKSELQSNDKPLLFDFESEEEELPETPEEEAATKADEDPE
jgi:hypothetical protein